MKLIYWVVIRITLALTVILTGWAFFFFYTVMEEVNDEVDDSLEDYSETIIIRALAGEELPTGNTASNNQYFLRTVTPEYAACRSHIIYRDSMVYIPEKGETEPARILTTLFCDDDGQDYELTVYTPSIEKHDLIVAIAEWMVFLYVTLLLIIIIINIWVFWRNMRPLYVLLDWLDRNVIGGKKEPLHNPTRITEFRKLNEAVNDYAGRSEQLFEQQKHFIGNASHEMQTPLAICINRMEMMMEDETLTESQLEELAKTHHTLEHLTRLNRSLLLLSKIENGQFTEHARIEVNTLLKRYLGDYEEVYGYRNITIGMEEQDTCFFSMNETLAVVLFTNLLKNAFVHNVDGGRIRILITAHSVTFCNTGSDCPLDAERIFERFYQGKKKEGSTGLGLAIADTICKMQSARIRYYYKEEEHCFEVSQPAL